MVSPIRSQLYRSRRSNLPYPIGTNTKSYGFEVTAAAVDDFLFWLEFFFFGSVNCDIDFPGVEGPTS